MRESTCSCESGVEAGSGGCQGGGEAGEGLENLVGGRRGRGDGRGTCCINGRFLEYSGLCIHVFE